MKKVIWASVVFFLLCYLFSVFSSFDLDYFDGLMRSRFNKPTVSDQIVIVAVDDESIGWLGGWPWPRSLHAQLIENLKKHGTRLIALDIIFDSPQTLSLKGKNQDQLLAAAIQKNNPVILASLFTRRQIDQKDGQYGYIQTHNKPLQSLARVSAGFGFANPVFDNDGVVRRSQLKVVLDQKTYQSFSAKVAENFLNKKLENIPLDQEGFFTINYRGSAGRYRTVPFNQVLDGSIFKAQPEIFKNKIVLVGSTAVILQDFFSTPFNAQKIMSGVEVRAHEIDTLLGRQFIYSSPKLLNFILLTAGLILMGLSINHIKGLRGFIFLVGVLLGVHLTQYFVFNFFQLNFDFIVTFTLGAVTQFLIITLIKFIEEEKEKYRIRSIFQRYVSPAIVDQILKERGALKLAGEKKEVTVLFSDIRGFTAFSENHSPEEVVTVINDYFETMSKVITDFGGTLDKYVGDQIMAVWNAPTSQKNHAVLAVRSALAQLEALKGLQQKWQAAGQNVFDISIGINTGQVVVGNMGSTNHLNYTVMGDPVNLAARLQMITRHYDQPSKPCMLVISQNTYDQVKELFKVRPLGEVILKGKSIPVAIYEVLGELA